MTTLCEKSKAEVSQMNPELRREFERLRKLSRKSENGVAEANYCIGETLAKVRADVKTYGEKPVNTLARCARSQTVGDRLRSTDGP